jgi:hypothetical protein
VSKLICAVQPEVHLRVSERGELLLSGPGVTRMTGVREDHFRSAILEACIAGESFVPNLEVRWSRHAGEGLLRFPGNDFVVGHDEFGEMVGHALSAAPELVEALEASDRR